MISQVCAVKSLTPSILHAPRLWGFGSLSINLRSRNFSQVIRATPDNFALLCSRPPVLLILKLYEPTATDWDSHLPDVLIPNLGLIDATRHSFLDRPFYPVFFPHARNQCPRNSTYNSYIVSSNVLAESCRMQETQPSIHSNPSAMVAKCDLWFQGLVIYVSFNGFIFELLHHLNDTYIRLSWFSWGEGK